MAAPGPATPAGDGSTAALNAGIAVMAITLLAVIGPVLGLSPWIIALAAGGALTALSLDAWRYGGRGGHLLAEALPGGASRLRRIALHEAGHALAADHDQLPVRRVLVGSLACLRQGLSANGSTEFELPAHAKLPAEELRRWSRVLQAGMVAEQLLYGNSRGGADDKALLGRLWGLSGFDVATAQLEQRRARREVEQLLRARQSDLEGRAEALVAAAPRLLRRTERRQASTPV
ncbi:hypothetical protein KBY97_12040 [Synechococcus sp. ATX 2A4]|uniref:hypothetical protein n=1 Tax=Synechococcus sp. ATX 2A4 TaxID=2823727 RepID=UPI0020CDE335|nr:hypothetical protein [Synechococcus sp. ATX 2A4]MCP9885846.1 hypothetical protein [Synechococcus sp. ATX 2A4]